MLRYWRRTPECRNRQTMATQNRLGSRPWGFESLLRHQSWFDLRVSCRPPTPWRIDPRCPRPSIYSSVEGAPALLAGPEADHVALEMRLRRILEIGAAVGELPVVDKLDLAALDGELHPQARRVHDRPHHFQGLLPLAVERVAGQIGPGADELLVEASQQRL